MARYNTKTLEHYTVKYGDLIGNRRYQTAQLRQATKQFRTSYTGPKVKCELCGTEMKRITSTHLRKCSNITIAEYRAKFPDAPIIHEEMRKGMGLTEEKYLKRYGPVLGAELWKRYCDKQSETNTFEYKQKHYGWTREQFDEYNKSRAATLENMIKRHGDVEGRRMFDDYCEKQRYTTTIDYFIEEYGLEEGTRIYNNFCEARSFVGGQSGIELECYSKLAEFIPELELSVTLRGIQCGAYDYGCCAKKKLFEFNGDFWHANPATYDRTFVNTVSGRSAEQIWEHDASKISRANSIGYEVYVIWESAYRANPDGEIQRAVEWFNRENAIQLTESNNSSETKE